MRELVISKILECTDNGELLEEMGNISLNELYDMPDEELLEMYTELAFGL